MEIGRREFLKLFGGVTGTAVLGGCGLDEVFSIPERLIAQARKGPGIETWKSTTCGLCSAGCGIRVRLVDGLPVYIKGSSSSPVNRGGMCPLGLNALHHLYHPDRLKCPMKRVGKPGHGRWEPIGWDEALKTVADTLGQLRSEGKSHEVAFLGHDERNTMRRHITRFMRAYGSPNYYQFSPRQNDVVSYMLTQGTPRIPGADVMNAKLVVSFGSNFLEEGYSPVYYTKLFAQRRDTETRYIQIEPRLSLTGSNADQWVPIRPGTYGAFALGIAYVLIREELYDKEFVKTQTFGFEEWADRNGQKHLDFKSFVLGNYYPERVAELTGVSSAMILEIAREVGNTRPALVIGGEGLTNSTDGTLAMMAVHSLNAMLGNFERAGGFYAIDEPPFTTLQEPSEDSVARDGNRHPQIAGSLNSSFPLSHFSMQSFAENILSGRPYPTSVLFLFNGNPLFETLNHGDFARALEKIPLVVSFDTLINETSEYAHLILPNHTFLETWGEVSNVPSIGFSHVGIQQPVVEPLYETRHTGDVLISLARQIGGTVGESFSFETFRDTLKKEMEGIYRSGEGAIYSEGVKRNWLEYLRQRGWQIGRYSSYDEFWTLALENGGWWNPAYKTKPLGKLFATPSGKFEFYSQRLKSVVDNLVDKAGGKDSPQNFELVLNGLGISARGDSAFFPHHEPAQYRADLFLHLVTFRPLTVRDGAGAHLPMMQEMFGLNAHRYWNSWLEIHPTTASEQGIADGQPVWLQSSLGNIRLHAKVTPGMLPNVVAVPFGLGHTSYGRYAKGHGVNPNSIMESAYDLINGKPASESTKVKISAAI